MKKNKTIIFRLSEAEKKDLEELAKKLNKTISGTIRAGIDKLKKEGILHD